MIKKIIKALTPCKHTWITSEYQFSSNNQDRGCIGYFCKKCGNIKCKAYAFKQDLEAERDNYFNLRKG